MKPICLIFKNKSNFKFLIKNFIIKNNNIINFISKVSQHQFLLFCNQTRYRMEMMKYQRHERIPKSLKHSRPLLF